MRKAHFHLSKENLEAMTEEATVDCYNESEQLVGWLTMIEDNLKVPFETRFLGITVKVERIDMNRQGAIVAICRREKHKQSVPILDLPPPSPLPAGAEWIEAYRRWSKGNA
jgi:hypothetical protein